MAPIAPSEQETGVKAVVNERGSKVLGHSGIRRCLVPPSPPPCLFYLCNGFYAQRDLVGDCMGEAGGLRSRGAGCCTTVHRFRDCLITSRVFVTSMIVYEPFL